MNEASNNNLSSSQVSLLVRAAFLILIVLAVVFIEQLLQPKLISGPAAIITTVLPNTADQSHPVGAFGGGSYAVVFREGSNYFGQTGTDLIGARIAVSDPTTVIRQSTISAAADSQEQAAVAYGSNTFLVVWQDLRNGRDYDIYGTRVQSDGTVLDTSGILIAGGPRNQVMPSVTFDGTSFLVAWANFDGTRYEIRSANVSLGGSISSETLQARTENQHSIRPQIINTGNGLWLFWNEARSKNRLMTKKLSTNETFQVSPTRLTAVNTPTVVAMDGRYVLLAWSLHQEKSYSSGDIIGVIWDSLAKAIVMPDPANTTIFRATGTGAVPGVLWIKEGTNFNSSSPFDGNVQAYHAVYDGKDFWVTWSTIHFRSDSWGPVLAHRISTRRINPGTGSFYGERTRELLSGPTPLRNPFMMSNSNHLILLYETEASEGQKIIQSKVIR